MIPLSPEEAVNQSLEDFVYKFDDYELASILTHESKETDIYLSPTIQRIVDAQFRETRTFFVGLLFFYLICFALPFILIVFEYFDRNSLLYLILDIVCFVTQTVFLILELI